MLSAVEHQSGTITGYSATIVCCLSVVCLVAITFRPVLAQEEQSRAICKIARRRRGFMGIMDVGLCLSAGLGWTREGAE